MLSMVALEGRSLCPEEKAKEKQGKFCDFYLFIHRHPFCGFQSMHGYLAQGGGGGVQEGGFI